MTPEEREALLGAMQTLMVADNFGDVHEVLNALHDLADLPHPEGDYLQGWTESDYANVGFEDR